MKTFLFAIIVFCLLTGGIFYPLSDKKENNKSVNIYYPVDKKVSLIYESSFGEATLRFIKVNNKLICKNEGIKFKYEQTIEINENGVYVDSTYQYFKIFLFISKEKAFTYSKPLLRLPSPLTPGTVWEWEGKEYAEDDTSNVKITGKVFEKEIMETKAGSFDAIKVETVISNSTSTNNTVTEWYAENVGLVKAKIKIDGGGLMGFIRDVMGYGDIEFVLKEIKTE